MTHGLELLVAVLPKLRGGWTVATVGGLAALYYGPKKALETFEWYMDRFRDYKVRDFLRAHITMSSP